MNASFNITLSAINNFDGDFITESHKNKMGVVVDTFNDSNNACLCFEINRF